MGRNRVVVLDDGSLLVSGVLSLLRDHPAIECIAIREDGADPQGQIRASAPDVIVVAAPRAGDDGPISVARFLGASPRARIVILSVERPGIEIYDVHRVEHASVADFLTTIARGQESATGGLPRPKRRRGGVPG